MSEVGPAVGRAHHPFHLHPMVITALSLAVPALLPLAVARTGSATATWRVSVIATGCPWSNVAGRLDDEALTRNRPPRRKRNVEADLGGIDRGSVGTTRQRCSSRRR